MTATVGAAIVFLLLFSFEEKLPDEKRDGRSEDNICDNFLYHK